MAFVKSNEQVEVRTEYNPYNQEDLKIILDFEKIIQPYEYNFDTYTEAAGLTTLYGRYALLGAVKREMSQMYRETRMQWSGLSYLRWKRERAKNKSNDRIDSLITEKEELENKMLI